MVSLWVWMLGDPLCLIQISSGKSDAHIVQFDRENYIAPNLVKILSDEKVQKYFIMVDRYKPY